MATIAATAAVVVADGACSHGKWGYMVLEDGEVVTENCRVGIYVKHKADSLLPPLALLLPDADGESCLI